MLFRVFIASGDPKAHAMKQQLWRHSEALVPFKHVFDFNQGLMDLGATVCTARGQKCAACPMRRFCRSADVARPAGKGVATAGKKAGKGRRTAK